MTESNINSNVKINFSNKKNNTNTNKKNDTNTNNNTSIKKNSGKCKNETPVRIGSLLGMEQVGQCMFMEYQDDIILMDAGMEFSANETLGADYIIPDVSYLKKNKHKVKGVIITHGHLDHIGALKHILPELDYPVVYTTPLTLGIIKKTFSDQKALDNLKYQIIDPEIDLIKLGCFSIEFVGVNHNIPETLALAIHTPKGLVFNSADFKVDYTPAIDKPADLGKIARMGTEGVKLYIGDSLGSQNPGWGISEKVIGNNLDNIIQRVNSRLLIATFASNVGRIIQIIQSAVNNNKVVFLSGRSIVNNVEICQQLGYINVPRGTIRKLSDDVDNMPANRVVILCTGAQGEEFSALARIARGDHTQFKLREGDTVLMSASTIPGNELPVSKMLNELVLKNLEVITNDDMDIHASGHGFEEDHKLMLNLLKPEYFLPYYTEPRLRYAHRNLALSMGMSENNILMPAKNGHIIELYSDEVRLSEEKLELDTVMIDGLGIGHLSGEYVMKARQIMSENGILSLIFKIDSNNKNLVGNIQIESRGFVYSSEVKKIHTNIVEFAKKKYYEYEKKNKSTKETLKFVKDDLGDYLMKIVGRTPMIIPMFVYINKDGENKSENKDTQENGNEESIVGMTLEEQGGSDN